MPRLLRIYLVGCIAVALTYLALHTREPVRLNVGDPWSDAATLSSVEYLEQHGFTSPLPSEAYRPAHDGLTAVLYRAVATLGVRAPGTFRMIALAFSVLWASLVFLYARRIWGDSIALLATALFTTSLLWLMYADSIDRPPIVHASCFFALWGLASAIETRQRRHHAALLVGSFGCLFGGLPDWGLLLTGVLFTVSIKRGNPFAPGNLRFLVICGLGVLAALATKSWFVSRPVAGYPGSLEWQSTIDRNLVTLLPTLLRRYAVVFTPMFWITLGYAAWRAVRAPALSSLLDDGTTWLLAVAAIALTVAAPRLTSPMLRAQPVLPFYAIATAILIARLLEGGRLPRALGVAWAAIAPAWGLYLMLSHPRSVLDREDVARTRAYLASHDRNDFVLSNLLSDGPIQAAFDRHNWPALELDQDRAQLAWLQMLNVLEATGAEQIHAVIFTTPDSRFVDRSLGQLVVRRRQASVTGWPYLVRSKANELIGSYDKRVHNHLEAVGATRVLELGNFDVYRIDRATVLELAGKSIPVVRTIDFSSPGSDKHKLLGWGSPRLTPEDPVGATSIMGRLVCWNPVLRHGGELAGNACETQPTRYGISAIGDREVARGQLMIRVDQACDLRLTLELAPQPLLTQLEHELASSTIELAPSTMAFAAAMRLDLALNDFSASQYFPARQISFVVPQRSVRAGINLLTLDKQRFGWTDPWAYVTSLAIEPLCELAR